MTLVPPLEAQGIALALVTEPKHLVRPAQLLGAFSGPVGRDAEGDVDDWSVRHEKHPMHLLGP